MSNGRLKASTNRVRTSIALQSTSIWTNAIGLEAHVNTNEEIERQINAPTFGGGGGRAARRAAAAEVVEATGGFDSSVNTYSGLLNLARSQGAITGQNRGACKKCGQLGHLTKQCKNEFSRFYGGVAGPSGGFGPNGASSAAGAAGVLPLAGPAGDLPPVPEGGAAPELSSDLSDLSSSESDSDSESDSRKRKERKRRRKEKKSKEDRKRKRSKKEKTHKKKSHKSKRRRKDSSSSGSSDSDL